MDVVLYRPSTHIPLSLEVHRAMSAGLRALGIEFRVLYPRDAQPCDLAIVQGWVKAKLRGWSGDREPLVRAQQSAGKPILCIERGYLGDRAEFSALCWNGFNNSADWSHVGECPSDRWDQLGIDLAPWRRRPIEVVLLCGQIPGDANVDDVDYSEWLTETCRDLVGQGVTVLFREHPKGLARGCRVGDMVRAAVPSVVVTDPTQPLDRDLYKADAVVAYNSNASVESVIAGVPTIVMHQNSMAWPMSSHDLNLRALVRPDRRQWAWDLAYKQWRRPVRRFVLVGPRRSDAIPARHAAAH